MQKSLKAIRQALVKIDLVLTNAPIMDIHLVPATRLALWRQPPRGQGWYRAHWSERTHHTRFGGRGLPPKR